MCDLREQAASCVIRMIAYLTRSIEGGTHWEDGHPTSFPVNTADILDVLLSTGFQPDTKWVQGTGAAVRDVCLANVIAWLNAKIGADGAFGEDLYDVACLADVIEAHSLSGRLTNSRRLELYLRRSALAGDFRYDASPWGGAAFESRAAQFFLRKDEYELARRLTERIVSAQDKDGAWRAHSRKGSSPSVPDAWHTAQVVGFLATSSMANTRSAAKRGVHWLRETQEADGSWVGLRTMPSYCVAHGVRSLAGIQGCHDIVERAVAYIIDQTDRSGGEADGRFADPGATALAAHGLFSWLGKSIVSQLSVADHVRALEAQRAVIASAEIREHLEERARSAEKKYAELQSLYAEAQARSTNQLPMWLAVAGAVLTGAGIVMTFQYVLATKK